MSPVALRRPLWVILVEDDRGTRNAMVAALGAAGADVLAAVESGEALLEIAQHVRPDVALVDLKLPGMPGSEVIRRLRKQFPDLPILVLSVVREEAAVMEAIEAGANGYLLKEDAARSLRDALDDLRAGRAPLSSEIAKHVLARARVAPSPGSPRDAVLTEHETAVLGLLALGHSYGAVAKALGIQHGAVRTLVNGIYGKLAVSSKAEATAVAHREGLLRLRE